MRLDGIPLPRISPFAVSVHGNPQAVREALRRIMLGLSPLALPDEERTAVELAIAEVLNNVVEHAYPEGGPDATVDIACSHENDGLHILIRDRGEPMRDEKLPQMIERSVDVATADLPESGFGWWMIAALTKDLKYRREGGENYLSFRVPVGQKGCEDG
ncbi:ATP-binding protein [Sulfitobacter sp. LCG007]